MKYIRLEEKHTLYASVIVFDESVTHAHIAAAVSSTHDTISAGFCHKKENRWIPHGKSDSLKLLSRPDDYVILNLALELGLTGLDLQNHITLMEIEQTKRQSGE